MFQLTDGILELTKEIRGTCRRSYWQEPKSGYEKTRMWPQTTRTKNSSTTSRRMRLFALRGDHPSSTSHIA